MSRYFPLTWAEWKGSVDALYRVRETLEDRLVAGESLSEEEKIWLAGARKVTARYDRSGHKKKGAAPRMQRTGTALAPAIRAHRGDSN